MEKNRPIRDWRREALVGVITVPSAILLTGGYLTLFYPAIVVGALGFWAAEKVSKAFDGRQP
jgi:hypothetical protein